MALRQARKPARVQTVETNLPQHLSADPANARPPEQNRKARPEGSSAQLCISGILRQAGQEMGLPAFFIHTASTTRRRTSTISGLVLYIFSTVTS